MQTVPPFMQRGSKGPIVNLLLAFLCGAGFGKEIVFDAEFGEVTEQRLKEFQLQEGIDSDGCFGPQTRVLVRGKYFFDFEMACQFVPGKTTFMQDNNVAVVFESKE